MLNSFEGLLEVYEDMVDVLLVLEIFLTEDSQVEDLLCGAASCSETCLFFSDDLFRLRLQFVQYDLQRDVAWMAGGAENLVVLELLQFAFLGKCDDRGLGPGGWPFPCLSDLVADCHDCSNHCFCTGSDQFCWDVGNCS